MFWLERDEHLEMEPMVFVHVFGAPDITVTHTSKEERQKI